MTKVANKGAIINVSKKLKFFITTVFALGLLFVMAVTVQADTYVTVTGSPVNVRSSPQINDSNRVGQVSRGTVIRVTARSGDFFRGYFPGIGYAYISRDWVAFYSATGTLTGHAAWIFDLPCTNEGEPISLTFQGDTFSVVSYDGNWYGIIYEGELAFVERHHMDVSDLIPVPPARSTVTETPNDSIIDEVIARAMNRLGTPYRWGGNGPYSFDCSGFVIYVLRPFGVTLPRRSRDMVSSGTHVDRADVRPGDLLFFATAGGRTVSHVGMYIGGGQLIHSSSTRSGGVIISNFNSAYYVRTFVTARRVL